MSQAAAGAVQPLRHVLIPVDGTPQAECVNLSCQNYNVSLMGMNPPTSMNLIFLIHLNLKSLIGWNPLRCDDIRSPQLDAHILSTSLPPCHLPPT